MIEDDYYLADDTRATLEDAGAVVVGPCARLDECLSLLDQHPPDCAVVDINLGHGPSFGMPGALRAHAIPFAFLTGYDATEIPMEYRGIPRLEKPVDPDNLVKTVNRLCGDTRRPI